MQTWYEGIGWRWDTVLADGARFPGGCGDPIQFGSETDMRFRAMEEGWTLQQVASAEELWLICDLHARPVPAPAPPPVPAPAPVPPPAVPGPAAPAPFGSLPPIPPVLIAPVTTGEPTSTVIATILAAIFGLFLGGGTRALERAVTGLRAFAVKGFDALMRFGRMLARTLGKVIGGLHAVWTRVVRPMLAALARLMDRLARLIDRVLKPYLEFMERARQAILDIYDRFFRPMIDAIQATRQALAVLKVARVPFARKLDERLARLEGKIYAPIGALLRALNDHGGILNTLFTARMILQRPVLLASLHAYQGAWVRMWWNAQLLASPVPAIPPAPSLDPAIAAAEHVAAIRAVIRHQAGPLAPIVRSTIDTISDGIRRRAA
jgi:hypothetical protein